LKNLPKILKVKEKISQTKNCSGGLVSCVRLPFVGLTSNGQKANLCLKDKQMKTAKDTNLAGVAFSV
jgi:hypothetical protein